MLYRGLIVDNVYQICYEIGSGGMGVVYLAYHLRLNKYVVLKEIKNPSANLSILRNEVDILKSLHHPYLPQVYDFITYENNLYTVIDYIDGYDLKYYIDNSIPISESQLIKWLRQLCEVLDYLHTHDPRVLHTDIKPANIIVRTNGDICLIDFGISILGHAEIKGISADYSSPEQYYNVECIKNGYYDSLYELDERTDIYSVGASFFHIISGLKPSPLVRLSLDNQDNSISVSDTLAEIINTAVSYDKEKRFAGASNMLKAVNNIFKQSTRYKLCFFAQTAFSVIACLMIVFGSFLVIDSINNSIVAHFEDDYNDYLDALNYGDIELAESRAKTLLNDSDYNALMDKEKRSEILHGLGDCYFEENDLQNALSCYQQAVECGFSSSAGDVYYRDYALALLKCGKTAEASSVLEELNEHFPDSASGFLIQAQMKLNEGDADSAEKLVLTALSNSYDADTKYTAYLTLGDMYYLKENYSSAVQAYSDALQIQENAVTLRKLGICEMDYAQKSKDSSAYDRALSAYSSLFNNYFPTAHDAFNMGQCYLLSGNKNGARNCISLLERYMDDYSDNCQLYILMAIAADSIQDERTSDYCLKAKVLYGSLSQEEKKTIDSESLKTIQMLYRKYFKEVW